MRWVGNRRYARRLRPNTAGCADPTGSGVAAVSAGAERRKTVALVRDGGATGCLGEPVPFGTVPGHHRVADAAVLVDAEQRRDGVDAERVGRGIRSRLAQGRDLLAVTVGVGLDRRRRGPAPRRDPHPRPAPRPAPGAG